MAKAHVPIVITCWDDVPQVDKNLLWQDILENWDIPNDEKIWKKILSHIAVRWRDFKTRKLAVGISAMTLFFLAQERSSCFSSNASTTLLYHRRVFVKDETKTHTPQVYRLEKQPIAQPVNEAREESEDHDAISILTSRLNKLRKGLVEVLWEFRTFGLECHVPLYINFDDAYEIIGG
ncbi:hypothetical protein LR48_Vigan07g165300 [Vigna angularis]|uniref:Uncharacterized protein n=1 Tax=Phaseolus angularis TaxID=3914 RepID=A0A0L9UZK6_PHAAN|nr:hypothetical protein LR48_Vigan07g165300 [Vigna angularis]